MKIKSEQALIDERQELLAQARAINADAETEERELSRRERAKCEELLGKADEIAGRLKLEQKVRELGTAIGAPEVVPADPRSPYVNGGGWAQVASKIAVERRGHFKVATQHLLSKQAPVAGKALSEVDLVEGSRLQLPTASVLGRDQRFLYPALAQVPVMNQLTVSDFRQTGSRTVNGSVERDLTATSEKATLDLELSHLTEPLKQVAIVIEDVPNALLEGITALTAFLNSEAKFQLNKAIDDHVINAIELSDHPVDAVGDGTVARIRNGISDHRVLGYAPTLAAVPSEVATELDLLAFEAGGYVFDVHRLGSSSPLFGLHLVEVADLPGTFLIDPTAHGVLCLGGTVVDVDQSRGFTQNTSTIRVEASVLYVVRNAAAAFEVGVAS